MAEITTTGYKLKTQNEYFEEERARYIAIDPKWNLDPSTPDGLKLASDAEIWANLDEMGQQAYNSKDPAKAKGYDLDVIAWLTGTRRSLGTPSTVTLTLSGVAGTVIIAGQRVESTENGSRWTTNANVTIGSGGTVSVAATCSALGDTQASPATITRIIDTVGGWQAVTNPLAAVSGTNKQTDQQLRIERAKSVGRPGNNQIDSMLGEVFAVDGVRRCKIYENDTNTADSNALPAHSIAVIADGGTDDAVAMAIYLKKNPGCLLHQAGTAVDVTVVSPSHPQNTKLIKFSRPIDVNMTVVVAVKSDGSLPSNIGDLIAAAIMNYAAGDFVAAQCGYSVLGFDIGESVPFSRMYAPIMQVLGQYGNSYITSLTLNGGSANVAVAFNQLSRWATSRITVSVT